MESIDTGTLADGISPLVQLQSARIGWINTGSEEGQLVVYGRCISWMQIADQDGANRNGLGTSSPEIV